MGYSLVTHGRHGRMVRYHPLFGSLRQRCQWGTGGGTAGDPPCGRESWMEQRFPAKLCIMRWRAGDAMLRDILLNPCGAV